MTVCRYCESPLRYEDRLLRADGSTERLHAGGCARSYYAERKAASRARHRGDPAAEARRSNAPGRTVTAPFCDVARCLRPHYARGLCVAHYRRERYGSGDVFTPIRGDG